MFPVASEMTYGGEALTVPSQGVSYEEISSTLMKLHINGAYFIFSSVGWFEAAEQRDSQSYSTYTECRN